MAKGKGKKPARDVGDREQVKERKVTSQLLLQREQEELRQVLSTPAGQNVLWRIVFEYCGVFQQSPMDPDVLSRFSGRREIGLQILDDVLTADQEAYIMMMRKSNRAEL